VGKGRFDAPDDHTGAGSNKRAISTTTNPLPVNLSSGATGKARKDNNENGESTRQPSSSAFFRSVWEWVVIAQSSSVHRAVEITKRPG